jgi:energy-coupling factor transporter transmembrane protein EcfT
MRSRNRRSRSGEARSGEARSGEARSGEARAGEARSGKTRSPYDHSPRSCSAGGVGHPPVARRPWDARPLLLAFVVVNAVALSADALGLLLLLPLLIPAVALRADDGIAPPGALRRALPVIVGLFLLVLAGHGLDLQSDTIVDPPGLLEGTVVCLRLVVLYASAATLTALVGAVGVAQVVRWLVRFVHPPFADRVFHMVVLTFRFLPRLWEIASETRAAAKLRSPRGYSSFRGTVSGIVYRFVLEADRAADAATVRRFFAWTPPVCFEGMRRSLLVGAASTVYSVVVRLLDSGAT